MFLPVLTFVAGVALGFLFRNKIASALHIAS